MLKTKAKTAADVMSRDVVSLSERDSLQEAMKIMTEQHVSGVPVLDPAGHCLGVISTSDIVAFIEADQEELEGTSRRVESWFNPETQKWEESTFSPDLLGEYDSVPVADAMTSDPLTVTPATPIAEVARLMVDNSVHRVFVVDDQQRLEGVVSAFDFVEMVAEE
ncbi:CBS domain-containing protein [bacterium]|nr:CBS domain-containing protein [bacterium]